MPWPSFYSWEPSWTLFWPWNPFLDQKWLENKLEHILYTIPWLQSFSNEIIALKTIFYEIRGLQSILNVFSMLEAVFSASRKKSHNHHIKMPKSDEWWNFWNLIKWPKTVFFFVIKSRPFMIKSHKWLKIPKSDKMTKTVFFFMIKSHKWLKIPKSCKMTQNGLFFSW